MNLKGKLISFKEGEARDRWMKAVSQMRRAVDAEEQRRDAGREAARYDAQDARKKHVYEEARKLRKQLA
ncbi:MAG: hypothetical protein KKF56_03660 [Nanoarchaeota archaeon]|nr:hypothetical protein [Nanoarchaeota archaeon]